MGESNEEGGSAKDKVNERPAKWGTREDGNWYTERGRSGRRGVWVSGSVRGGVFVIHEILLDGDRDVWSPEVRGVNERFDKCKKVLMIRWDRGVL